MKMCHKQSIANIWGKVYVFFSVAIEQIKKKRKTKESCLLVQRFVCGWEVFLFMPIAMIFFRNNKNSLTE